MILKSILQTIKKQINFAYDGKIDDISENNWNNLQR